MDEIIGQEHITTTLKRAIESDKLSHAYLLTGPKGVGKTSIARILAHEINKLPYSEDTHLDIIEIDAASNRRIDEIRDLRDHIHAAPASAKYKVFIIDEVHMLTKEAFNALLKTLEEPPAHVIFILATTEMHKLPETIISRTQRYSFRPIPLEQVVGHLQTIANEENISVENDALKLIAEHGEGSFRDSISLLDQAAASGERVTKAHVENLLGRAPADAIDTIASAIDNHNHVELLEALSTLYEAGYDAPIISLQLASKIREAIVFPNMNVFSSYTSLELLRDLLNIPSAQQPKQLLEVVLLSHAFKAPEASKQETRNAPTPRTQPAKMAKSKTNASQATPVEQRPPDTPPIVAIKAEATSASTVQAEKPAVSPAPTSLEASEIWEATLNKIKRTQNTLYGVARMAKPSLDGDTLRLLLRFKFHFKQLNTAKNAEVLQSTVQQVSGKPILIALELQESDPDKPMQKDISTINNIFGSTELL